MSKIILTALAALFLSLAMPVAPASAAPVAAERAPAERAQRAAVNPEQSTDREADRYAERERQSSQLERFEGGRTVIVITSLGALLLGALLVLLLI